ncbi:DEAD/DEAH box helicase family protein [Luminiphilus sp.]|nr:DEAD/DEAH box helicase family protein [Luminiphilus sp.]
MSQDFRTIHFPKYMKYSSDTVHPPVEFYLEAFSKASKVWLKLGYFSSQAFRSIAFGFAQFIANGGKLCLVTNHHLYDSDKELIFDEVNSNLDERLIDDLSWMTEALTDTDQQFLDCLKLLLNLGRLEIVPVMLKPGGMAHYKEGVFEDALGNLIHTNGSANFTGRGILFNGESLSARPSWLSDLEQETAEFMREDIQRIVDKTSCDYFYLSRKHIVDQVKVHGVDHSVKELLKKESQLLSESESKQADSVKRILSRHKRKLATFIEKLDEEPSFPFAAGPHEYQVEALRAWINNDQRGIFAMATGTGKTITALNCALETYKAQGVYQLVVLVPYNNLVEQWVGEVRKFNFKAPITISSKTPRWRSELKHLATRLTFDPSTSFVVISTYDGARSPDAQEALKSLGENVVLIADEAHNAGAKGIRTVLADFPFSRKIALSATLTRRFDDEGNQFIEKYFASSPPYTFEYSMRTALDNGVLCRYKYYPVPTYLNEDEMIRYKEISAKLAKLYDHNEGRFWNPDQAKFLLLERSRIIHKAEAKIQRFLDCCRQISETSGSLKYTFVYVPEGNDLDGENMLDRYMRAFEQAFPGVRFHHYTFKTAERDDVLDYFEKGAIDVIFSMKCLDEGVDIPRAENAVFCSSTGNPRQFVQRRGRILRTHEEKGQANVYDLVVIPFFSNPSEIGRVDKHLMNSELARVVDFASLSDNYYEATDEIEGICRLFGINIHAAAQEVWETQSDG